MIGVDNLEVIHTGTLILYDWDLLGSSIYIVDILRIDDLRIDDQSSILRSSIYSVFSALDHRMDVNDKILPMLLGIPYILTTSGLTTGRQF